MTEIFTADYADNTDGFKNQKSRAGISRCLAAVVESVLECGGSTPLFDPCHPCNPWLDFDHG